MSVSVLCVVVLLCVLLLVLVLVLCVGVGVGGGGGGGEANRTISQLVPSAVSHKITEAEQLDQVKRMIRGIRHVLFSTCSQTENG